MPKGQTPGSGKEQLRLMSVPSAIIPRGGRPARWDSSVLDELRPLRRNADANRVAATIAVRVFAREQRDRVKGLMVIAYEMKEPCKCNRSGLIPSQTMRFLLLPRMFIASGGFASRFVGSPFGLSGKLM
jgi:hypothetical protein